VRHQTDLLICASLQKEPRDMDKVFNTVCQLQMPLGPMLPGEAILSPFLRAQATLGMLYFGPISLLHVYWL
jgi:hypothetical protein